MNCIPSIFRRTSIEQRFKVILAEADKKNDVSLPKLQKLLTAVQNSPANLNFKSFKNIEMHTSLLLNKLAVGESDAVWTVVPHMIPGQQNERNRLNEELRKNGDKTTTILNISHEIKKKLSSKAQDACAYEKNQMQIDKIDRAINFIEQNSSILYRELGKVNAKIDSAISSLPSHAQKQARICLDDSAFRKFSPDSELTRNLFPPADETVGYQHDSHIKQHREGSLLDTWASLKDLVFTRTLIQEAITSTENFRSNPEKSYMLTRNNITGEISLGNYQMTLLAAADIVKGLMDNQGLIRSIYWIPPK